MINPLELSKQLLAKTADMTKSEQFSQALTFLWHTKYGYGRENILQSDCSGLVSAAFYLTGIDIRITADMFFNKVFTDPEINPFDNLEIKAYFVIHKKTERAVHVAPIIENGVCLDFCVYTELLPCNVFYNRYFDDNHLVMCRECLWYQVEAYSKTTRCVYGLDPELKRLRKV